MHDDGMTGILAVNTDPAFKNLAGAWQRQSNHTAALR